MSIAEKLTTIAENVQKVYEAGKSAGGGDYDQGYEDGKNSVVEFTRYMTQALAIKRGLLEHKDVVINLDRATTLYNLFNTANVENKYVEHITVNCPNKVTRADNAFCAQTPDDTVLKHITLNADISQATTTINLFRGCKALEIIDGTPLDFSSTNSMNIFNACKSVKEFRVVKNSIKLSFAAYYFEDLSVETIQSIIDGLADLTDSDTQTLTVHANVYDKIIANGWDTLITAKNWTLVSA